MTKKQNKDPARVLMYYLYAVWLILGVTVLANIVGLAIFVQVPLLFYYINFVVTLILYGHMLLASYYKFVIHIIPIGLLRIMEAMIFIVGLNKLDVKVFIVLACLDIFSIMILVLCSVKLRYGVTKGE